MATEIVVISGGLGTPSTSRMLGEQLGRRPSRRWPPTASRPGSRSSNCGTSPWTSPPRWSPLTPPRLAEIIGQVERADALIAVSPVFTASVSGLFKSFLDVLDPAALDGTPVAGRHRGIGAPLDGDRLRDAPDLQLPARPAMPTAVFAAPEDWAGDTGGGQLADRAARAGAELARASVASRVGAAPRPDGIAAVRAAAGQRPSRRLSGPDMREGRTNRSAPHVYSTIKARRAHEPTTLPGGAAREPIQPRRRAFTCRRSRP